MRVMVTIPAKLYSALMRRCEVSAGNIGSPPIEMKHQLSEEVTCTPPVSPVMFFIRE